MAGAGGGARRFCNLGGRCSIVIVGVRLVLLVMLVLVVVFIVVIHVISPLPLTWHLWGIRVILRVLFHQEVVTKLPRPTAPVPPSACLAGGVDADHVARGGDDVV